MSASAQTPAAPAATPDAATPPATTIWSALGEVAAILSVSPGYKFYTLADLEWLVMPALQADQFRLCHKGARPIGVVFWAKLDAETASHMLDPRFRLRPDQWCCGDQVWITDVVHTGIADPELTATMLQDVRNVLGVEGPMHVRPLELIARLRGASTPPPAPVSA
jgi:hemolysin-activating ACP:hemolysin acyltransferase